MPFPPFDEPEDLYPEPPASDGIWFGQQLRESAICLTIYGTIGAIAATMTIVDFLDRHERLRFAVTAPPLAAIILAAGVYDALANIRLQF